MKDKKINTEEKTLYIIGWVLILLLLIIGIVVKVKPQWLMDNDLSCPLLTLTGLYCPGCGGTRAVIYLIKGNLIKSFLYHPFVLYTALIGGWFMISHTIQYVTKGRLKIGMKYRDIYLWIALLLVLISFVVKNVLLFFGIDVLAF